MRLSEKFKADAIAGALACGFWFLVCGVLAVILTIRG